MRIIESADREAEPLVVVSNRLPYNLPRKPGRRSPKRNVGGLVNALEPVLARRGGCWIGWDGSPLPSGAAVDEALASPLVFRTRNGIELHGIPLSEREVRLYYNGFANRALWPLFHDFHGLAAFLPEDYAAYDRVNRRFAEAALARAVDGSRIWVHDLHLLRVPRHLRDLGFRGRIDFFLHTPFPPPEIYRALPWREELLRGVLAADAVAFHVPLYRDNFAQCACQVAGAELVAEGDDGPRLLWHEGNETEVVAYPIGIDVDEFERIARLPAVVASAARLREAHGNRKILLCADRLDYTKGIRERLQFFERFLVTRPAYAGKVVLLQIVVPSRHQVEEYRAMKQEVDRDVGRINGEQSRDGWTPVHYRYLALEREDLVAHYLAADVAMVTSVRDGMNLVAAEFAASRVDGDGVLIVSEFAGIADRCPGAIRVNPYDVEGCSAAIASALEMPPPERSERMATLRARVRSNPSSRWADRCLGDAERPPRRASAGLGSTRALSPVVRLAVAEPPQ